MYADLLPASDGTAPFAIHTFNQITGGNTIFPRQAAIANDHFVFTGKRDDDKQTAIGREFARLHGIEKPYYATPGDGIFHFYFPEQGLVVPGQFIPGADSHSRAYGAYGAVGIGVGSTTLGFGWSTGYIYFTVASARRVSFAGRLQPWVSGKDIVLELLRRWGAGQSQGMSVEFVDRNAQLPMTYRNTIANMMAEGEALNGIFAADDITRAWYDAKGITDLPYPLIQPGADARYEIDETLDLSDVRPDRQAVQSRQCLSGDRRGPRAHYLRQGADRLLRTAVTTICFCRTGDSRGTQRGRHPRRQASSWSFRARAASRGRYSSPTRGGGESIAAVFESVGGQVRQSWCGPCFGRGPDAGERTARHHVIQPELAEPHGFGRRRVSGKSCGGGGVGASRIYGATGRARSGLERGGVWCLILRPTHSRPSRGQSVSPSRGGIFSLLRADQAEILRVRGAVRRRGEFLKRRLKDRSSLNRGHPSHQSQLPSHLRGRTDCRRLSRRRMVQDAILRFLNESSGSTSSRDVL